MAELEQIEELRIEILMTGEPLENFKKVMKIHRYGRNGSGSKELVARSLFREALRNYLAENDTEGNEI